jgi:hypothetical protein
MKRDTKNTRTVLQLQGCRLVTVGPPDMLNRIHGLAEALCDQRMEAGIRGAFVARELLLLCKELMRGSTMTANDADRVATGGPDETTEDVQ